MSTTSSTRTGVCGASGTSHVSRLTSHVSEQQLRELVVVLRPELLLGEPPRERAAIRDDEVIDVAGDDDVRRKLRGVAQDLRHEHAPLPVDLRVLTEVVDALEKLRLRAMDRGKLRELLLERAPDAERIEEKVAAGDGGDEEVASERFLDLRAEESRHLEPALLVETSRRASPKAVHPSQCRPARDQRDHFLPLLAKF